MEKGLLVLLLCCAGVLIAEGLPAQEQQQVIEMLQQELSAAKPSEVGFPANTEEQENGFPSVSEEQEEETAEEERYRSGVVYTRWGKRTCPRTARLVYFGVAAGAHALQSPGYCCKLHLPATQPRILQVWRTWPVPSICLWGRIRNMGKFTK